MDLHRQSSICYLRHVQKQIVHNVLRSDPVSYLMVLTSVFKSYDNDYKTSDLELLLGVLLYCSDRLDWIEERACIRFVSGVTE